PEYTKPYTRPYAPMPKLAVAARRTRMSRDGFENPAPAPMSPINVTTVQLGTAAVASVIAHAAATTSEPATKASWRSPWDAEEPPAAMPAALPSRYAVRPEVATPSETP